MKRTDTTLQRITYELSPYEVRLAIREYLTERGNILKDGAQILYTFNGFATVVQEFEQVKP